jgi:segregation and condensation protein B
VARRKQDLEQLSEAVSEASNTVEEAAEVHAGDAVGERASIDEAALEQFGVEENQAASETEDHRLRAMVEAIVYITDEPLQAAQIATALTQPEERIQQILNDLVAEFNQPHHGLALRELADGYQMGTKAEHHEELRQFVKKLQPPLKLSLAALETLAVIAYKQPVTAPEILEIRGVQGAGVLKTLLDRKLVQIAGRKAVLGKPALYRTTKEFLVQFGLKNLSELPTLKEFEELSRLALGDEAAEVEQGELALDAEADEAQAQVETQIEAAIEVPGVEPATPAGAASQTETAAVTAPDDSETREN